LVEELTVHCMFVWFVILEILNVTTMSFPDYYKILQLPKNATVTEIRKAYAIFQRLICMTLMAYQNCLLLLLLLLSLLLECL